MTQKNQQDYSIAFAFLVEAGDKIQTWINEAREIEERTSRIRAFTEHLYRFNPDTEPKENPT